MGRIKPSALPFLAVTIVTKQHSLFYCLNIEASNHMDHPLLWSLGHCLLGTQANLPILSLCWSPVLNQNGHIWSSTIDLIVGPWKASMCFANAAITAANLQDNFYIQPLIKEAHLGMDDFLRGARGLWERDTKKVWPRLKLLPAGLKRNRGY